jgi:hypothetical protein
MAAGDFQAVWECISKDSRESKGGTWLIIATCEMALIQRQPWVRRPCVPSSISIFLFQTSSYGIRNTESKIKALHN